MQIQVRHLISRWNNPVIKGNKQEPLAATPWNEKETPLKIDAQMVVQIMVKPILFLRGLLPGVLR